MQTFHLRILVALQKLISFRILQFNSLHHHVNTHTAHAKCAEIKEATSELNKKWNESIAWIMNQFISRLR